MALSQDDAARLALLRAAYDKLISGSAVAKVSAGGRSVDYQQADIGRLKTELDALAARDDGAGRTRRPLTFRFL